MKIPPRVTIGGQQVDVLFVHHINDNLLGVCCLASGYINIAETFHNGEKQQSRSSMENTFIHELLHCCLDSIGRSDLSNDETFVNSLASILTGPIQELVNCNLSNEEG